MSVTHLVHAKNELFFFQTYFYGHVAVQFLVPLKNSEKKIKTETYSINLYICVIHVYLSIS